MDRVAHAVSRRRHDRRPEAQQVSQPVLRPRRVQPPRRRLRHPRGLRFADGPDLSGDGHRQPDAPHELDRARDPRRHRTRARRAASPSSTRESGQVATRRRRRSSSSPRRRSSPRGCCCSRSRRTHPNGIGNSSSHVGHNFCEHVMGPGVTGLVKERVGKPRDARRRPARRLLRAALPQPRRQAARLPSRLRLRGRAAARRMFPGNAHDTPGLRRGVQEARARLRRRVHQHGRLRRGAAALREPGRARSGASRTRGASRSSGSTTSSATTRRRWRGHGRHRAGDVRGGRDSRSSTSTGSCSPRAGRSTSSARRAWARDPKTSVLNQFQQSHDVKNLFVVDGSSHVNASCQNPTWTIMALAWRSCDYLVSEFRKGNL